MSYSPIVYLGIKGSVMALDAATGEQVWATHLTGSGFVHVMLDGAHLYAITAGEIFCLKASNGDGLWHNPLKGFGLGLASMCSAAVPANTLSPFAEEERRSEEASSAAAHPAG